MRGSQIAAAAAAREALSGRVRAFFGSHDLLLCPVSMVAPFDVGVRWGETPLVNHFWSILVPHSVHGCWCSTLFDGMMLVLTAACVWLDISAQKRFL